MVPKHATMARVTPPHPSARLFDLMAGMMRTQTIAAVAELGVADAIAAGVTGTDELAREVAADPDALRRMLRLLEADGLLVQDEAGGWALTETGELLRDGVDGSLRQLAMFFGAEMYEAWAGATASLRTGEPAFEARFGARFFDWLQTHPIRGRSFDRAMSGTAALRVMPLLARDWSGSRSVVDVGGGNGMLIEALLEHVPGLHGITFDLPQVSRAGCDAPREEHGARRSRLASSRVTSSRRCLRAPTSTCWRRCCTTGATRTASASSRRAGARPMRRRVCWWSSRSCPRGRSRTSRS